MQPTICLTIETVLLTLTQFARGGLIRLLPASRSIALCNKMALKNLDALDARYQRRVR